MSGYWSVTHGFLSGHGTPRDAPTPADARGLVKHRRGERCDDADRSSWSRPRCGVAPRVAVAQRGGADAWGRARTGACLLKVYDEADGTEVRLDASARFLRVPMPISASHLHVCPHSSHAHPCVRLRFHLDGRLRGHPLCVSAGACQRLGRGLRSARSDGRGLRPRRSGGWRHSQRAVLDHRAGAPPALWPCGAIM